MSANRYATIFLILFFNINSLFAQCYENDKAFFDDSQRGWFWGESCKKKLEKKDENKTDEEIAKEGLYCLENYMKELGLVMKSKELGVTESMIRDIARKSFILEGGYKKLSFDEVVEILEVSM